jgi:hypothetical protein
MKKIEGNLLKMKSQLSNPITYTLPLGDENIEMNALLGKELVLIYKEQINCIHCGRKTSKSFFQGYCYPCFKKLPQTDEGVLHPEKCQSHLGISRDMEWAKVHDLIDHFVYLAITSGLKVGVTRHTQIPTRWIDQGAVKAIRLAKTPHRNLAGLIEVELKTHLADKTNWRNMLKNVYDETIDLNAEKLRIQEVISEEFQQFITNDTEIIELNYPVLSYPSKIKSLSFDKTSDFQGKLIGIKGQYLIFEGGVVFNVRKHNGYLMELGIL